jgi:hypothetical protein
MSTRAKISDFSGFEVIYVRRINGTAAFLTYKINRCRQGVVKVYRDSWATHPGYWPPVQGDIFDPKFGTLRLRPR